MQGQNVGCLQTGMLKQSYNITYMNSIQENWERGVMGGEESKHKGFKRERKVIGQATT